MAKPVFAGDSRALKSTTIEPALSSRLKPAHNTIWTAAFEAAWRKMESDVVGGPIVLDKASSTSLDLGKAAPLPENTLPSGSKARAFNVTPQTAAKLMAEMSGDLETTMAQSAPLAAGALVAYSKLKAHVPFTIPYFDYKEPLKFGGEGTPVKSFGIRPADEYDYYDMRGQPRVLYKKADFVNGKGLVVKEFAIDLCADSKPCQIVVACVPSSATLAGTLAETERKIAWFEQGKGERFGPNDVLQVPEIVFDVTHHFRDLEGARLMTPSYRGTPIIEALEKIQFELTKSGAYVKASAKEYALPVPSRFIVDRPFLIYVKNRAAKQPFFVMWIANAELLRKW